MELRFVPPDLTQLDAVDSELLACSIWEDRRPMGGVAGLCDWRLAGAISRLARRGFLTGARGEVMLIPGRPRLGFDKILIFGAGRRADFDEDAFSKVMRHMLETIDGLGVAMAVVQLPGRQDDIIAAETAADMLLAATSKSAARGRDDVWTLVENREAHQRITRHMIEERRRIRRVE